MHTRDETELDWILFTLLVRDHRCEIPWMGDTIFVILCSALGAPSGRPTRSPGLFGNRHVDRN
jgi:hypothetical protein